MMQRLRILLIGIFFIASCSSVRPGKLAGKCYLSSGWTYRYPKLYVEFYGDSTFLYKLPYIEDITGRWRVNGDTVILSSPDLKIDSINVFDEEMVAFVGEQWTNVIFYKYTDLDDSIDAYIIKGDTLYPVMKDRNSTLEYLYAIPKPEPKSYIYNMCPHSSSNRKE